QPIAPYKQNQFGFTLGGPVVIPHVYNGKNRTFFFVDYEGLRIRQAQTLTSTVPTDAQRAGDFSSQLDLTQQVFNTAPDPTLPTPVPGAGGPPILDCNGIATYVGELFNSRAVQAVTPSNNNPTGLCGVPFGYNGALPSNVITGGLDPLALAFTALYPHANASANGFN